MVAMCIWKMDELEVWVCVHVQLCRYNGAYFQLAQDALVLLPIWHRTQKYYCSSLGKKKDFLQIILAKFGLCLNTYISKMQVKRASKLSVKFYGGVDFFCFLGGLFVLFFVFCTMNKVISIITASAHKMC